MQVHLNSTIFIKPNLNQYLFPQDLYKIPCYALVVLALMKFPDKVVEIRKPEDTLTNDIKVLNHSSLRAAISGVTSTRK